MEHKELTQIVQFVAGFVEGAGVKLETDDGKDDDGKEQEQGNVDQGTDGFSDRAHHHLQAWTGSDIVSCQSCPSA